MTTGTISRLRLARIAGDSVLKEKILAKKRLDKDLVGIIANQLKSIAEEMEAEWKANPGSEELRESFHLLNDYLGCLERYRKSGA